MKTTKQELMTRWPRPSFLTYKEWESAIRVWHNDLTEDHKRTSYI